MNHASRLLLVWLALGCAAAAQSTGIAGQWIEPTGSLIRVDHCGTQICMWVIGISQKAPSTLDIHNPDPAKRGRSLCGLQIGSSFVVRSQDEASGGTLYDPKTGKTYHGQLKLIGDRLELRGYVGLPLFGETQIWTRPAAPVKTCSPSDGAK